ARRHRGPSVLPYTTLFRSQAQQVGCGAAADVGEAHVEQRGRVTVAPGPCPNRERTCVSARPAKAASKRSQYSRPPSPGAPTHTRSEEHTSELQSRFDLVCR